MLSADHYALENRAVQQLIELRHREVNYLTDRFNSIGTQSSLIAGFCVSVLSSVDVAEPTVSPITRTTFWVSSALSLACSFHCLLISTFAAVWGPGMALRGPAGSVARAYFGLKRDQRHVMAAFVLSLLFFLVQIIALYFALDEQSTVTLEATTCSAIILGGMCISSCFVIKMRGNFSYDKSGEKSLESAIGDEAAPAPEGAAEADDTPSQGGGSLSLPLLRQRRGADNSHGGAAASTEAAGGGGGGGDDGRGRSASVLDPRQHFTSPYAMRGYLLKRGRLSGILGDSRAQWVRRYCVLDGVALRMFRTQQEFIDSASRGLGRDADEEKAISLEGYEVLVQTGAASGTAVWGFSLSSLNKSTIFTRGNHKRDRHFRASTESELRAWCQALVAASVLAN